MREISRLNWEGACKTRLLEGRRGEQNSWCSGGMLRYQEEYQWRKRLSGLNLTLRGES